jgi:hypothetical protein
MGRISVVTPGSVTYEVPYPQFWKRFLLGFLIDVLFVAVLLVLVPRVPFVLTRETVVREHVKLVAPNLIPAQQPVQRRGNLTYQTAKVQLPKITTWPVAIPKPPSDSRLPETELVNRPVSHPAEGQALPQPKQAGPLQVKTGLFSPQQTELSSTPLSARQVQTGGFEDPASASGNDSRQEGPLLGKVGSFDLPSGWGQAK